MRTNDIIARIEARLSENKSGVKTYASHQFARSKGERLSDRAATYFLGADTMFEGPDFTIVFLPTVKRWSIVFHLSPWLARHNAGGYVGIFADEGFFSC